MRVMDPQKSDLRKLQIKEDEGILPNEYSLDVFNLKRPIACKEESLKIRVPLGCFFA
jgi:hypothetical protein